MIVERALQCRLVFECNIDVAEDHRGHKFGRRLERDRGYRIPASDPNNSPARMRVLPGLIEPKFSLPGLALAASITSLTDLNGDPALVVTTSP